MKRGVKITIICGVILLLLIGIGVFVYFNFFHKTTYHVVGVEKTDHVVSDFADESELKFYQNNTFHIQIKHKEIGLVFVGIGTYTKDGNTYQLSFIQAFERDTNNTIVDVTEQCNASDAIICTRSGNRIKFTDNKHQTYYFG